MEGVLDALSEHIKIDDILNMTDSGAIEKERGYDFLSRKLFDINFLKEHIKFVEEKINRELYDELLKQGYFVADYDGKMKVDTVKFRLRVDPDTLIFVKKRGKVKLREMNSEEDIVEIATPSTEVSTGDDDEVEIYAGIEKFDKFGDMYYISISINGEEIMIYTKDEIGTYFNGYEIEIETSYIKDLVSVEILDVLHKKEAARKTFPKRVRRLS